MNPSLYLKMTVKRKGKVLKRKEGIDKLFSSGKIT